MEGDAGSGQLNPTPPTSTDDEAKRDPAEESANRDPAEESANRAPAEESANRAPAEESVEQVPPDETSPDEDDAAAPAVAEESEEHDSADVVEADEVEADEVEAEAVETDVVQPWTAPVGSSRLASRGWLVGICVILLLLTAGTATGGALALRSHQKTVAAARADVAALAAAKDCVAATQAPDSTAMAASQRKMIDCATGDFGAQAILYSGLLVDAYEAAKVQVQVTDMRAAVERHNEDGSIDVLVTFRVKVSNTQARDQEQGYRLRVRMALDQGSYKIAKLDQVSK